MLTLMRRGASGIVSGPRSRAFRTWDEWSRRPNPRRRAVVHWLWSSLSRAFGTWVDMVEARRGATHAILQMASRGKARALRRWVDYVDERVEASDRIGAVLHNFKGGGAMGRAWRRWCDVADGRAAYAVAAARWVLRAVAAAIERWRAAAARPFRLAACAFEVGLNRRAAGLARWHAAAAARAAAAAAVREAIDVWRDDAASAALRRLGAYATGRRRLQATARRVARRVGGLGAAGVVVAWSALCEGCGRRSAARRRQLAAARYWAGGEVARAWAAWATHARRSALSGAALAQLEHFKTRESFGEWKRVASPSPPPSSPPRRASPPQRRAPATTLSAATTAETEVTVFGAGGFGQLGSGGEAEVMLPTTLPALTALRVRAAACGEHHTAFLTASGEVFTCGLGQFGALGHGSEEREARPRRVEAVAAETVVGVACGWRHTAALTTDGALYLWGHGGFGQLGHGGWIHFYLPLALGGPQGWEQVSCGARHTAALADGGIAYTWGDAAHLQLGHGGRQRLPAPRRVEELADVRLVQLECGAHHCAAVAADGTLWTWGSGAFGQLGHGGRMSEALPRRVGGALTGVRVLRVACGGHTLALGAGGELYAWGNGKHGQLGHGGHRAEASPKRVAALRKQRVVGVAAGDFHSLALTADLRVFTFGSGAFGELGHGTLAHLTLPTPLDALRGKRLLFAACGSAHNILLTLDDAGSPGYESATTADSFY